jgi:hypothetical protein
MRAFSAGVQGKIGGSNRIPLNRFREPITVLRVTTTPDPANAEWHKNATNLGDWISAVEEGEKRLVRGEKISRAEYFLFVIPYEAGLEFAKGDYVVWKDESYSVEGTQPIGDARSGYLQINTLPYGKWAQGEITLADGNPVDPSSATIPATVENPIFGVTGI